MSSTLLACETLRDELDKAMGIVGGCYDVQWVESGLHNVPDVLRTKLQESLDMLCDCKRVLMAFGCCGNAVIGLKTGDFELVIPRVDDCISMLIGSIKKRMEACEVGGTYFLTPGWLRGERTIWVEYQYSVEKYGEEIASSIMETMLGHYTYLGLLDTKSYNLESMLPEVTHIADTLHLKPRVIPASVNYLCDLLKGPWSEDRFVVVPPCSVIQEFPLH